MKNFFHKMGDAWDAGRLAFAGQRKNETGIGYTATDRDYMSMFGAGYMRDNYDLTFYQAIIYYCHVQPIATAVDMITDEFRTICPVLYDGDNDNAIIRDHKMLDLLKFPNADTAQKEFLKQWSAYYNITGNAYIMATGTFPKPPLELFIIQPQRVTMQPAPDGFVGAYNVNIGNEGATVFKRREIDGRFRFFDDRGRELWHTRVFNPRYAPSQLYGMSLLNAIYYEIEQYLRGNRHNLSMLKNGARPAMALISEAELSDDQRERLAATFATLHEGAENAGRTLFIEGSAPVTAVELSKSPRDMDWMALSARVEMACFKRLKIPMPLISGDNMTLANYTEARLALYDNAVIPLCNFFDEEITEFLAPRYGLKEAGLSLGFDENSIPALAPRRTEIINMKARAGVLTINEIRKLYGYEEIENGDTLYQSATMIPLGQDRYTADNLKKPAPSKEYLHAVLVNATTPDGKPMFTPKQIDGYLENKR